MIRLQLILLFLLSGLPLAAQENAEFVFGGDVYQAGQTLTQSTETEGDVFIVGENVNVSAPATGSVHLLGRLVTVGGEIGVNAYAAGQQVTVSAPVKGSVTIFGQDVTVTENIGGNLRAMGQNVTINGDVTGSALMAGETLTLNSVVTGDVSMSGNNIVFGDAARIDGQLMLYHEDPESVDIPPSVINQSQVTRHVVAGEDGWVEQGGDMMSQSLWAMAKGFLGVVVAVAVAAIILAALFPKFVAGARGAALGSPLRTVWIGFLALSATVGSMPLLVMTGVGILLLPVSIFLILLLWFLGYVIGAYTLGVGLIQAIGRGLPDSFLDRAVAALIGAVAISLLALIPYVGWWVVLIMIWIGSGAVIAHLFRPGFFTDISKI